jgi:SpoIID/LytB domain protein
MKTWNRKEPRPWSLLLFVCLILSASAQADEVRVGLSQTPEVEFRCDGPFQAIVEGGSGGTFDLQPGIYLLRAVETGSFYRAAPLVAGIISTPMESGLNKTSVFIPPAQTFIIDLVRTQSISVADRAEKDARQKLRGKITRVEQDGWFVVQTGPFPNEYLANQTLSKARSLGFPAQMRANTVTDAWERATANVRTPKRIRRLIAEGGEQQLEVPVDAEMGIAGGVELEPLEPLPQDIFDIEPLPTLPPGMLEMPSPEESLAQVEPTPAPEPLPEPESAELGPDLGWVPAPAPPQSAPPLKRMAPRPSGPQRSARAERRLPPPPSQMRSSRPPQPRPMAPRQPEPRLMPKPEQVPPQDQMATAPQPPAQKRQMAPSPSLPQPELSPPPRTEMEKILRAPAEPPAIAEAPSGPRQPSPGFQGQRQPRTGWKERVRNFPIIRKFWWEDPLVEAVKPPITEDDFDSYYTEALQQPAAPESYVSDFTPDSVAQAPSTSVELPGVAPTPLPFDPDAARDRLVSGEGQQPSTEISPAPGTPDELDTLLPPGSAPGSMPSPDLASQEPSWDEPTFPTAPPVDTAQAPSTSVPGSDTLPSLDSSSKRLGLPQVGPVRGGYVQLFDVDGKPVTDPVTVIDLVPGSSSRLEFGGHSFHGSFQAYAPGEDWMCLVNKVDLEDYLAGIVPLEIPDNAPLEVLKAQAVMSRCYAILMAQRGDYAAYGYDLPGTPDSEWPYIGRDGENALARQAVLETEGEVLVDSSGGIATPVYCFSSGGYVADAQSVWGETGEPIPPYLTAKPDFDPSKVDFQIGPEGFSQDKDLLERWLTSSPDTYDKKSAGENFRWTIELSNAEMDALVNAFWNDQVGEVEDIQITDRAISGHATRMVIKGEKQTVTARDSDSIRQALGLNSSLIVIKDRLGPGWVIHGGGFGHGVGLSQCGAIGLVEDRKANYRQVLYYYFENLKLGKRSLARVAGGA